MFRDNLLNFIFIGIAAIAALAISYHFNDIANYITVTFRL